MCSNSPVINKVRSALVVPKLHLSFPEVFLDSEHDQTLYISVFRFGARSDFVMLLDLSLPLNHKCTLFKLSLTFLAASTI